MNIKIKHPRSKKCFACKYQRRINALCEGLPFGIEYDFFKEAGDVAIHQPYTLHYGNKRWLLHPPFEVQQYKRGDDINLLTELSDAGIKKMIEEAKRLIEL